MKRQTFRLGAVLRFYVLQKQRAELELRQASRVLHELEAEICALATEIAALAELVTGERVDGLTTAGWIACYQKADTLDRRLAQTEARRVIQLAELRQLEEKRKRWALAEETLLTLRRTVDEQNEAEAAKAGQILLDEAVLRRWLEPETFREFELETDSGS